MKFRLAQKSDLPSLFEIFKRHGFIDPELDSSGFEAQCVWQYMENPPQVHFQWVAEDQEKIAGHYGMISIPFEISGETKTAGLGSNLFVDPAYRNGLLFLMFQRKFLSEYSKHSVDLTYSLVTRPEVLKLHNKTGVDRIGDLPVFVRPYKSLKLAKSFFPKIFREVRILNGLLNLILFLPTLILDQILKFPVVFSNPMIEIRELDGFGVESEGFLKKFSSQFKYLAQRTPQTLNWRFFGRNNRRYRVFGAFLGDQFKGYVALRKMAMKDFVALAVVDLVCMEGDTVTLRALMSRVHAVSLKEAVDVCTTIQNPELKNSKKLKTCGFLTSPEKFTLCAHKPGEKIPESSFNQWFVSWYDNDYV